MGGCCCGARKSLIVCCPRVSEQERFASRGVATSGFASGLFVDLDLNTSTPDTFRPPPTPLPYESLPVGKTLNTSIEECKSQGSPLNDLQSPKKPDAENVLPPKEEEEACAICLNEYDEDNPKLETKCQHHFHLCCIMEWMERSDTCPMCDNACVFATT